MNPLWLFLIIPAAAIFGFFTAALMVAAREDEEEKVRVAQMRAFDWDEERQIDEFKVKCTCGACPEQYSIFDINGNECGYLRLRHGVFRVDYPTCGGEVLFDAFPRGDGLFDNEKERDTYMLLALDAIRSRMMKE